MRDSNQKIGFTGIYARIGELQLHRADRDNAIRALRQAERVADGLLWVKEKLAALGGVFLSPSLKH
jgi:hypothetical protein